MKCMNTWYGKHDIEYQKVKGRLEETSHAEMFEHVEIHECDTDGKDKERKKSEQ